jgi:hypothetical protein
MLKHVLLACAEPPHKHRVGWSFNSVVEPQVFTGRCEHYVVGTDITAVMVTGGCVFQSCRATYDTMHRAGKQLHDNPLHVCQMKSGCCFCFHTQCSSWEHQQDGLCYCEGPFETAGDLCYISCREKLSIYYDTFLYAKLSLMLSRVTLSCDILFIKKNIFMCKLSAKFVLKWFPLMSHRSGVIFCPKTGWREL